jgi:hypothetical protein
VSLNGRVSKLEEIYPVKGVTVAEFAGFDPGRKSDAWDGLLDATAWLLDDGASHGGRQIDRAALQLAPLATGGQTGYLLSPLAVGCSSLAHAIVRKRKSGAPSVDGAPRLPSTHAPDGPHKPSSAHACLRRREQDHQLAQRVAGRLVAEHEDSHAAPPARQRGVQKRRGLATVGPAQLGASCHSAVPDVCLSRGSSPPLSSHATRSHRASSTSAIPAKVSSLWMKYTSRPLSAAPRRKDCSTWRKVSGFTVPSRQSWHG